LRPKRSSRQRSTLDPEFALAHVGLADALTLQIEYSGAPRDATLTKAEIAAGKALQLDPYLAEAWTSSANVAESRNHYDLAEQRYRKAIELNPNYATAHQWYSNLLSTRGRLDAALGYAEKALALDPLSAVINRNLANLLEASGRFAEAETRYRRVIAIDPAMPWGYVSIGQLDAYALNRLADAVPFLKKASDLDPDASAAALSLVWVYFDLGEVSATIRLMQAAQRRWPPDDWAVNSVSAQVYASQGELDAAVRFARKALEVVPQHPGALSVLDVADLKNGDASTARSRYAQAYPELLAPEAPNIDGSNFFIAVNLVPILQKTGEGERATLLLDLSEQVTRTIPRLGLSGYGITDVQIHALRGDKGKALAALREAEKAGLRGPLWRYYRDFDPALASIRNEPEFKAVFADIERDMAKQRAALAARPKDAPLDLAPTGT
jgi:tetratricopeptide (TPR) repeat protein